ncbi:MAG: WD40/YVTN/BNR-like repeat-containing protein [Burkholderiales bacterium]
MAVSLLVSTRKGAFIYRGDSARRSWCLEGPHFLGSIINHLVAHNGTFLMAAKAGHLGPTVFRSRDDGQSWQEAKAPPAFKKAAAGQESRAVDHVFCLVPTGDNGNWYAGTSSVGLFRSDDDGISWSGVAGFNEGLLPKIQHKIEAVPDGSILHSIVIDPRPRDSRHMYVALSTGGVFETFDAGETWRPLNKGVAADFLPEKDPEFGHDPHLLALCPSNPDRLYQQNHCGIYRLDRPAEAWERIGASMPKEIGDIGFPLVLHPRDPDTLWVFPMDGTDVWPRVSPGGKPAAYVSRDGGAKWQQQDSGLPREHAWFTVKRQAFCADSERPLGLYFGTTSGEIWMSRDEGENWELLASHLPHILAITAA